MYQADLLPACFQGPDKHQTYLLESIYIACTLGHINDELCQSLLCNARLSFKLCTS